MRIYTLSQRDPLGWIPKTAYWNGHDWVFWYDDAQQYDDVLSARMARAGIYPWILGFIDIVQRDVKPLDYHPFTL